MFETERLLLRRFADEDADQIFAMRSDAEFMRFIKSPETRNESLAWMRMVSRYWETDNFGFWAVVLKETAETIGWSGTWRLRETNEPEIGFAVAHKFWGRGFAHEAARVAVRYSFENRLAAKIAALTMPENTASRRVMEKLGMRYVQTRYFGSYGLELAYYQMTKEEYARNSQVDSSEIYAR